MSSKIKEQTYRNKNNKKKGRSGDPLPAVTNRSADEPSRQDMKRPDNKPMPGLLVTSQMFTSQTNILAATAQTDTNGNDVAKEVHHKTATALKTQTIPGGITISCEPKTKPMVNEPKAEVKPEIKTKPKTETKPEVKPKPDVRSEVKPKAESKPEIKPKTELNSKTEDKPNSVIQRKPEIRSKSEPKPKISPRDEGKATGGDKLSTQVADKWKPREKKTGAKWVKHPLLNRWQLWYFKPVQGNWSAGLNSIIDFETVEDFWAMYNHIVQASQLNSGCDYSLFKYGIKPEWEHPVNREGGRWLCQFAKNELSADRLNNMWMEVLMCLVGEAFGEDGDQVCGVTLNIRTRSTKIALWTRERKERDSILRIGNVMAERLSLKTVMRQMVYESHVDNEKKKGSLTPCLYFIDF